MKTVDTEIEVSLGRLISRDLDELLSVRIFVHLGDYSKQGCGYRVCQAPSKHSKQRLNCRVHDAVRLEFYITHHI